MRPDIEIAREAQLRHALQSAEARIAELERRVADHPRVEDLQAELEQLQERVIEAASILGVSHGEVTAPPPASAAPSIDVSLYESPAARTR